MSNSEALNNYKIEIRSLIVSYPNGCFLSEFLEEYKKLIGKSLPAAEFGFKTDIDFLKSMPDVVKVTLTRKKQYRLLGVGNEKVKHIQKMVSKQKPTKLKNTPFPRFRPPRKNFVSPTRFRKSNSEEPTISQTSVPKEPKLLSTETLELENNTQPPTKLSTKDEIILLVQKHKNKLPLDDLLVEYKRMYNKNFHLSMYGRLSSVKECIDNIEDLRVVQENNIDFVVHYSELEDNPRNENPNSYEVHSGWQDYMMNVQESLCYMYKHKIGADVTIQANKGKDESMCFFAHKILLAMRSPVFADLFHNNVQQNCILSVNFNPRAFDILLWYMYSDTIEANTIEELTESFQAAIHYKVYSFCANCAEKLENLSSDINVNNVCSVLRIANYNKSLKLRHMCLQFIKKEPEKTFLSEDFVFLDKEIVLKILTLLNLKLSPKVKLKTIINWMLRNEIGDRVLLSSIDFSVFSANDFLDIVEEYPHFFSGEEMRGILSNLTLPEPSKLPQWCKLSKTKEPTKAKATFQKSNVSNLLYEGLELVKKYAVKLQTTTSERFSKFTLHSQCGFEEEILMKIIIRLDELKLVMLELAFGSDYIPISNLNIELFSNIGVGRKMKSVKFHLIPSLHNYYLLFEKNLISKIDKDFNLFLKVKAVNLNKWGSDGPISNQKYRVAAVPNYVNIKTERTGINEIANLKTFSEWVLFINPESGEKKFLVSALFFDNPWNIHKYLKHLK